MTHPTPDTPAVPPSEAEALAEVLNLSPLQCSCGRGQHDFCGRCIAEYVLASDWLVKVKADARAEALLGAADEFPSDPAAQHTANWLRARAALAPASEAGR